MTAASRPVRPGERIVVLDALRRVVVWGLGIGLPVNFAFAKLLEAGPEPYSAEQVRLEVLRAIGVTPLALGYVAGFALLWRHRPWRALLGTMAPAGRAALRCSSSRPA